MANGKEFQLLRDRLRSFDNRKNGFGNLGLYTVAQLEAFSGTNMLMRSGATPFRNADGSPWIPNPDDKIVGLDIPPTPET